MVEEPPAASGGGGGSSPVNGMPCEVAGVLAARCISCHGSTPSGGAPSSLVTRDDLLATSALGGTVAARAVVRMKHESAPMPPAYAGEALSAAEIAAVETWVNAGLPGGACLTATSTPGGDTSDGGSAYCRACTADRQCGGPANLCLSGVCGVDCTNTPCGANQRCANILDPANDYAVVGRNCVPAPGLTCSSVNDDGGVSADAGDSGGSGGGGATGGGGGSASGGGGGSASGGGGGAATGGGGGSGMPTGGGGGSASGGGTGADAGMACTTDTWANYGAAFFASTCASCHHHSGQFATKSSVSSARSTITSRISTGNMPEGTTLSPADKARILAYLNCGVP